MSTFNLPDLGEGLQQAEVVAWHVAKGDHVVADQPLVAVETEKAVVEIPAPHAGRIAKLLAMPGARLQVGAPLVEFDEGPPVDTGTVVGELAESHATATAALSRSATKRGLASPAVRARARELRVDLSAVEPSGPANAITMADVEAAAARATEGQVSTELRGVRRSMALNMARAWREVAHATLFEDADIDAWPTTEDVTVRLIRALIAGCGAEPLLNARFDATELTLKPNDSIDLGLAIDGPDGLFVPVLRNAARSNATQWRQEITEAKHRVETRTLTPADLRAPTITLSNFGTIAGRHAALIIVPPQVAILGAGRITERSVRGDKGIVLHRMLPLSLTFDHRAVSGGEAARFMRAIVNDLQSSA